MGFLQSIAAKLEDAGRPTEFKYSGAAKYWVHMLLVHMLLLVNISRLSFSESLLFRVPSELRTLVEKKNDKYITIDGAHRARVLSGSGD